MNKLFAFIAGISAFLFVACGDDSSSGPSDLTFVDESGKEVSINISTGSFKDSRDGQSYKTVTVGDYTWMAENLRYGTNELNTNAYGTRYYHNEAKTSCPNEWHLPSMQEWNQLFKTVEAIHPDSAAWALKSQNSWLSDTALIYDFESLFTDDLGDTIISSGNGGDIIGFNALPGGICNGYCAYEGSTVGFWVNGIADRDGYATYIRFETGPNYYTNDIYTSRARLFVRCISDKNTIYETLGVCNEDKESLVGKHDSTYYTCEDNFWRTATHDEVLETALEKCTPNKLGLRTTLQDTSYTCTAKSGSHYDYDNKEFVDDTTYFWDYTPKDTVLADCKAKGDSICQFRDSTFSLHSSEYWYAAEPFDVFGKCVPAYEGLINKLNKVDYVCQDSIWREASEADIAAGLCTKKNEFDTLRVKTTNYVCFDNNWEKYTAIEDDLGFCKEDGKKKTYKDIEFICDGKNHVWTSEFKDPRSGITYKSVMIQYALYMTENIKYNGDSLFTWTEAMLLDDICDSTYCAEESYNKYNHQGVCPDGWEMITYSEANHFLKIFDNKSEFFSTTGWFKNGNNRSGLNFYPTVSDTTFEACDEYYKSKIESNANIWLSDEYNRLYNDSWGTSGPRQGEENTKAYSFQFEESSSGYHSVNVTSVEKTEKAAVRCRQTIDLSDF